MYLSDFVFSKNPRLQGTLSKSFKAIYQNDLPEIIEFHGRWGSLAVSKNLYKGFQPYENDKHIVVVIGGPLLMFENNTFLKNEKTGNEGTKAVYKRWLQNQLSWDDDLSGPFVVLIIDKETGEFSCITDVMSFIPVFILIDNDNIMLSTHVDALANAGDQSTMIDDVSVADFILNGIVTFPHTFYVNIKQLNPASEYRYKQNTFNSNYYWLPKEEFKYQSIEHAATDLRKAITTYVDKILDNTKNIAQFISGGEDSRTLAGLLTSVPNRKAFIFLDQMNREGSAAKKAAYAYGANFQLFTRSKFHYLDILPACTDLVGSGSEYIHAHTYGFHEICKLDQFDAVFGGLFSDALLKGARIKKIKGSNRLPFIPQIKRKSYKPFGTISNGVIKDEILREVDHRRKTHFEFLESIRNDSAAEWFELWPSSQNFNIPNLHANRRLFRSFEPFMATEVVKISAKVPQKWKLNRKLFHCFAKPYLKQTKWLLHSEGRLPYFPWYINCIIQFGFWFYQKSGQKLGWVKGNQRPWADWNMLMNTKEWRNAILSYSDGVTLLSNITEEKNAIALYDYSGFDYLQRINLLQVLYQMSKKVKICRMDKTD